MTNSVTPMKFSRNKDLVYEKALALRNLLADVEDDWRDGTLIMDRWTHDHFMHSNRALRDFSHSKGRPTWAGLDIEVHAYQPPLPFRPYTDEIPKLETFSPDNDPFLLCIRFQKRENKRIVYIDDPDMHPYWGNSSIERTDNDDKTHPRFIAGYTAGLKDEKLNAPAPSSHAQGIETAQPGQQIIAHEPMYGWLIVSKQTDGSFLQKSSGNFWMEVPASVQFTHWLPYPGFLSPETRVDVEDEIARVVQSVNEWDDRTSPDDYPDHLLITSEELADILRNFAGALDGTRGA